MGIINNDGDDDEISYTWLFLIPILIFMVLLRGGAGFLSIYGFKFLMINIYPQEINTTFLTYNTTITENLTVYFHHTDCPFSEDDNVSLDMLTFIPGTSNFGTSKCSNSDSSPIPLYTAIIMYFSGLYTKSIIDFSVKRSLSFRKNSLSFYKHLTNVTDSILYTIILSIFAYSIDVSLLILFLSIILFVYILFFIVSTLSAIFSSTNDFVAYSKYLKKKHLKNQSIITKFSVDISNNFEKTIASISQTITDIACTIIIIYLVLIKNRPANLFFVIIFFLPNIFAARKTVFFLTRKVFKECQSYLD